jgi:hypothetical protein
MDVHHGWQLFFGPLRKPINCRHARRLAFEMADQVPHKPKHSPILRPLAQNLGLKRVVAGIKISPQRFDRLWDGMWDGLQDRIVGKNVACA